MKMKKNGRDYIIGVLFYCLSLQDTVKYLYLKKNLINLNHVMKENKKTWSYGRATDGP